MISRRMFLKAGLILTAGLAMPSAAGQAAQSEAKVAPRVVLKTTAGNQPPPPGASASGPVRFSARPSLDHTTVPKYRADLVIPPPMPGKTAITDQDGTPVDYYEIGVRQFRQHILPAHHEVIGVEPHFEATTVWSYGPAGNPAGNFANFNYPAFTLEAEVDRPLRVRWVNQLTKKVTRALPDGGSEEIDSFLSHITPVDQTLHWAYPQGGPNGSDVRPDWTGRETPGPYTGPVPMVVHVHGAHSTEDSDGYAEAWWLPKADDIPAGYARTGNKYDSYKSIFESLHGVVGKESEWQWREGDAVFQYPNKQRATTVWYHDHSLGMTRNNVYAGPAGFYLIRGGAEGQPVTGTLPGPAPAAGDAPGAKYYEIPLAIQDRTFNDDGSLFYPDSRQYFDGFEGPYTPRSDVAPIWNPEFFGLSMLVNGRTWPVLHVEPRRYRFRILNGCNSRTIMLRLTQSPNPAYPPGFNPEINPPSDLLPTESSILPFSVIGTEGGFLPDQPVTIDQLLMMPAERFDVIVDFSKLTLPDPADPPLKVFLINESADSPFGGGVPGIDFAYADPDTTGQVMQFIVDLPLAGTDTSADPTLAGELILPPIVEHFPGQTVSRVRKLSLNELESEDILIPDPEPPHNLVFAGPTEARLGTMVYDSASGNWMPMPMQWMMEVTEDVTIHEVEEWELYNYTMDAHPIHIHEVMFEVLDRQPFDMMTGMPTGSPRPCEAYESGWKDTVISYPGEVTRIRLKFDYPGLFVWHCHIVEHEDNEMMRPLMVSYRKYLPSVGG
jgi:spore coat protein A, manganese oxidase